MEKSKNKRQEILVSAKEVWPITMSEWCGRSDVPSIFEVIKEFGSWDNFNTSINKEVKTRYDPHVRMPLKRVETGKKPTLETIVQTTVSSGEFDKRPLYVYHITEKVRKELHNPVSVNEVYRNLVSRTKEKVGPESEYVAFETFSSVKEHLKSANEDQLRRYGSPSGAYFLVKDLNEKDSNFVPYLGHVSLLVKNKDYLLDLVGGNSITEFVDWKPRTIDLKFEDLNTIIDFLKEKYLEDKDKFFKNFGVPEGVFNLGTSLKQEKKLSLNLKKIHSFIGDYKAVSGALEVSDSRFESEWKPKTSFLNMEEADVVLNYLKKRYGQNSETFFNIYGSELGSVILAKDLKKRGHEISLIKVNSFITNGRSLERLFEVEDKRFKTHWRPKRVTINLDSIEEVVDFMNSKYSYNEEDFFKRYGNGVGVLNLIEDLKKEKGIKISPGKLNQVLSGKNLPLLLGVEDNRFKNWENKKFGGNIDLILSATNLLTEEYERDKDEFFKKYGVAEGMYNLAKDLSVSHKASHKNPNGLNIMHLCNAFSNPTVFSQVTGISHEDLDMKWKPRTFHLHLDTAEKILNFLRKEYDQNSDNFFSEYGTPIGSYRLAKKLKNEGLETHLLRIGSLVNKGNVVSRLLNIDDSRFETDWKPRELTFNLTDLENILHFLRSQYNSDRDNFFARYGSREGQILLGRDLEEKLEKPVGYLSGITGNKEVLQELLGIKDERFNTSWITKTIMPSGQNHQNKILDFIKKKYNNDPSEFFDSYGKFSGILNVARDLYLEEKIDIQLGYLTTLINNGNSLSNILGLKDKRFSERWNPFYGLKGKFSKNEAVLKFLGEKYSESPEEVAYRYGEHNGAFQIASDLEKIKNVKVNPADVSLLLNPKILDEQIGLINSESNLDFSSKKILIGKKDVNKITQYLTKKYHQDEERFFNIYGSRLGGLILKKELNLAANSSYFLPNFLSNWENIGAILGLEDHRFKEKWLRKFPDSFERITFEGMNFLSEGRDLPRIDEPITEDLKQYLKFRNHILRGTLPKYGGRGSAVFDVSQSANKDLILSLADLLIPQKLGRIEDFVDYSIKRDEENLKDLKNVDISGIDTRYFQPKQIEARRLLEEEGLSYETIAERLELSVSTIRNYVLSCGPGEDYVRRVYADKDLIILGKKSRIKTSREWANNDSLPSLSTILRHFKSWKNFMEVSSNEDVDYEGEMRQDEFNLRSGKLLYSFEPNIRQEGLGLLAQLGKREDRYQAGLKKGGEFAQKATDLFNLAIAKYDPFLPFYNGENKVLPITLWIGSYVKWTPQLLNTEERKKMVSIESGGYNNKRMYEEDTPIQEFQ